MHQVLKIAVVLWAWGWRAWVAFSHQWSWLVASFAPCLLLNVYGPCLDKKKR